MKIQSFEDYKQFVSHKDHARYTDFQEAWNNMQKWAGFREKEIVSSGWMIGLNRHEHPEDIYITAKVVGEDDKSFEFIVKHYTNRKTGFQGGEIIG